MSCDKCEEALAKARARVDVVEHLLRLAEGDRERLKQIIAANKDAIWEAIDVIDPNWRDWCDG